MPQHTYESAPATVMLARDCVFCRRPLLDSISVEIGAGPICRERYGMNGLPTGSVNSEAIKGLCSLFSDIDVIIYEAFSQTGDSIQILRGIVNKLTHMLACGVTGEKARVCIELIRALGFTKVAEAVEKALVQYTIVTNDSVILIGTKKYDEGFKNAVPSPCRGWWIPDKKTWAVKTTYKEQLWERLKAYAPGALMKTPKGLAVIPGAND